MNVTNVTNVTSWLTTSINTTEVQSTVHSSFRLPQKPLTQADFHIDGNTTINELIAKAVDVLDRGPNAFGTGGAVTLALLTPIALLVCVVFMAQCQLRPCCNGLCCFYWFNCTGCCKYACGGDTLVSGTDPETALQPDEEVTDPDVILGDDEYAEEELADEDQEELPRSTASEVSDEEESDTTSYDKNCKRCCDTVAACLENGDASTSSKNTEMVETSEQNGSGRPAVAAVRKSKANGKK